MFWKLARQKRRPSGWSASERGSVTKSSSSQEMRPRKEGKIIKQECIAAISQIVSEGCQSHILGNREVWIWLKFGDLLTQALSSCTSHPHSRKGVICRKNPRSTTSFSSKELATLHEVYHLTVDCVNAVKQTYHKFIQHDWIDILGQLRTAFRLWQCKSQVQCTGRLFWR